MAIQFPANPGGQTPINVFSPTSTPVANSDNSLTYVWDNEKWMVQSGLSGSAGTTTGGGNDLVFQENSFVCTTNFTLDTNMNALSAGPVTINDGVTITIPDNQNWVIL